MSIKKHLVSGFSIFLFIFGVSLFAYEIYNYFNQPSGDSFSATDISGSIKIEPDSPEMEISPGDAAKSRLSVKKSPAKTKDQKLYEELLEEARILAEKGKYVNALRLLDKAIKLDPEDGSARRFAADINCIMGKISYGKQHYERAEELFEEVAYYDAQHPCGRLGLALCAYKKDADIEKSRNLLEAYIKAGGSEAVAYQALGEIHYHMNDLKKAAFYMEKAVQSDPRNKTYRAMLSRIKREISVEKDFGAYDTRHFTVKYEGIENTDVGMMILNLLEEARIEVGLALDYYPSIPVTAILYTNSQFQDVTHSPAWANAIYDGKIRVPVKGLYEKTEMLERIIYHEYTHALIYERTHGNHVPVWLHEGLAQDSEGKVSEENEIIFQALAKYDFIIPLKDMEGSFLGLNPMQAKIAYAESLAAIKYIKTSYGEYALRDLLDELARGKKMQEAIKSVLLVSYEEFDQSFLEWLKANYIY